jgi:hypothetical protein
VVPVVPMAAVPALLWRHRIRGGDRSSRIRRKGAGHGRRAGGRGP